MSNKNKGAMLLALIVLTILYIFCLVKIVERQLTEEFKQAVTNDKVSKRIEQLEIENEFLIANIKRHEDELEIIKEEMSLPQLNLTDFPSFEANISWYTAGFESTGKNPGHPAYGITASGKKVQPLRTIAMDKRFPFGTKVLIDNIVYVVEDRGGIVRDNMIDIYVEKLSDIPAVGRTTKTVYILEWGGQY